MYRRVIASLLLTAAMLTSRPAEAQQEVDPRPVIAGMILQFQTGTPNVNWYSPQLWTLFAVQTANTGIYPQLQMLGPVQNVVVNQFIRLPVGSLYSLTAFHTNGRSDWRIGINKFSNRVEYADIAFNQSQAYSLPSSAPAPAPPPPPAPAPPDPQTPNPDPPRPDPSPTPPNPTTSDACQQFPDLC